MNTIILANFILEIVWCVGMILWPYPLDMTWREYGTFIPFPWQIKKRMR